jgi:hypothetical protein
MARIDESKAPQLEQISSVQQKQLEAARKQLSSVVNGLDAGTLRDSESTRQEVKSQVDDILSKFNW